MVILIKNNLHLIFFLGILYSLQAQSIEYNLHGKIMDQTTLSTLSDVTIIYNNKSIGTTSGSNGNFRLRINAKSNETLSISYLGYKKRKISISDFLNLNKGIIYLKQDTVLLNQIILNNKNIKNRLSPKRLFKKVRKKFQNDLPSYSYISSAYYKEKIKFKDKYVLFAESLGYAINMKKSPGATYLTKYKFLNKNTRLANIDSLWKKNIKKQQERESDFLLNSTANLNQYLRLIKYGVLSKKWREYTFKLDSTYYLNNQKVYKISFKGGESNGYLECSAESLKIMKIQYNTNDFPTNPFNRYLNANVSISFNYFNENVFLSKMTSSYNYKQSSHINTLHILSQKFNEFKIKSDEYWGLNELSINPYIYYDPIEWKKTNIKKDANIEKIKTDLASKIPLETQFRYNSGKRQDSSNFSSYERKALLKIESMFLLE